MDRTTAPNYATVAGKRVFQDRNLSTGVAGTTQAAADHTAYQEEIMAVIEGAGLVGNAANNAQLLAALRTMFNRGMQVFGTSGTFTVPPGVTAVKVTVIG